MTTQRTDFLLDVMPNRSAYDKCENDQSGAKMNELVLRHLEPKHQKTSSAIYKKEQGYFERVTADAFSTAVVRINNSLYM